MYQGLRGTATPLVTLVELSHALYDRNFDTLEIQTSKLIHYTIVDRITGIL